MNAVSKMIKEPSIRTDKCERHGEYTARNYLGNVWTKCPECSREYAEHQEALNNQKKAEEERNKVERRLKLSGIPLRFQDRTLESFIPGNDKAEKIKQLCVDYCAEFDTKAGHTGQSLIFVGKPGTGKTHLASAICIELMAKGKAVLFTTAFRLVSRIKEAWRPSSTETESMIIADFARLDWLVIDEIGVQFGSDTEKLLLFEVLNQRYENRRPTLFISNLTVEGVKEYLGERVFDRLREDSGRVFTFDWQTHRR